MNKNLICEYLDYLKYEKVYSNNTINKYELVYKKYTSFLYINEVNILNVEENVLKDFIYQLFSMNYKASTISNYISAIKSLYNYLFESGYITKNVSDNLVYPKKENKLFKIMYSKELKAFFESINSNAKYPKRDRLLFMLLYTTGIRVSECSNLKLSSIDYENEVVRIYGKGKKERIVPLKKELIKLVDSYKKGERSKIMKSKSHSYLFVNKDGEKLTDRGIRYLTSKYSLQSSENLKISPHVFRHTLATNLLNNGMNLRNIQAILGHESLSTTEKYTHLSKDDLKRKYQFFLEKE